MRCYRSLVFKDIDISQGRVVTRLRCGGILSDSTITNFLQLLTVQKGLKIGQYLTKLKGAQKCANIWGPPCIANSEKEWWDTADASVGRLQVGGEVTLARVDVNEVAHPDMARLAPRAVRIEVGHHVRWTSDVVVAPDAAPEPHPAVNGAQHQDHASRLTPRREGLVHAKVAGVCNIRQICKRIKTIAYIAPYTANCSCSGALRHRPSGRSAHRP